MAQSSSQTLRVLRLKLSLQLFSSPLLTLCMPSSYHGHSVNDISPTFTRFYDLGGIGCVGCTGENSHEDSCTKMKVLGF